MFEEMMECGATLEDLLKEAGMTLEEFFGGQKEEEA